MAATVSVTSPASELREKGEDEGRKRAEAEGGGCPDAEPCSRADPEADGGEGGEAASHGRTPEETLAELEAEEKRQRLERSRREFRNRRKIIIRNLPQDIITQEVYELLSDYDLKYCFVDKYKGTAFVTLLNRDQANSAIEKLHQSTLRDREISVQLQPTDALLCIANLPRSFTQQQFEELVRPFGNLERCFLVYSEVSGHSKGYGFVEYMKKDSAARAKSELLGKQLGTRTLYVHWTDVNQLTLDLMHSKCLCVDKLPHDYKDLQGLSQAFSCVYQPTYCQLAQGPDGQFRGFAVVEYETADEAEEMQQEMDGIWVGGNHIRVSFCAPGPPGRSMLPALIAAQAMAMNRGKGLLPEPNPVQILNSLNNPATLQLLLNPLIHGGTGGQQGILGAAPSMPLLGNPGLSAALLQLILQSQNPAQVQNALLGNPVFLQNLVRTQLMQNKENQAFLNKPGILGESPLAALQQNPVGLGGPPQPGKGLLGKSPSGLNSERGHLNPPLMPVGSLPNQQYHGQMPADVLGMMDNPSHTRQVSSPPAPLQGIPTSILGSVLSDLKKQRNQNVSQETGLATSGPSLLGEPPKDLRMPQNPYLNLRSVFPANLPANTSNSMSYGHSTGLLGNYPSSSPRIHHGSGISDYPEAGSKQSGYGSLENYDNYNHSYRDYGQERELEQYPPSCDPRFRGYGRDRSEDRGLERYSRSRDPAMGGVRGYGRDRNNERELERYQLPLDPGLGGYESDQNQRSTPCGYNDLESAPPPLYSSSPTSYFTSGLRAGLRQGYSSKLNPLLSSGAGLLGARPSSSPPGSLLKTPLIGHKRGASHLIPSPEPSPEGGYIGQHSQGLGGHYADSYLKRKRIF
ncbi:ribonucleoprotein PTB-binding 1 isoform X2 [Pristis pectinata]|uniref:ribonucleoprotein PTB-binding 1 isoform X2 n=1 Tax=Pristis pectinata TaxID=685728 RepID=UPI00223E19BC|nr:ribonucleoprotein PTB-binding 1 isoform X2 [Pristis pectinata]